MAPVGCLYFFKSILAAERTLSQDQMRHLVAQMARACWTNGVMWDLGCLRGGHTPLVDAGLMASILLFAMRSLAARMA